MWCSTLIHEIEYNFINDTMKVFSMARNILDVWLHLGYNGLPKYSDSSSFSNSSSSCWVKASIFLSASLGPDCLGGVTVNCNMGFTGFFPFNCFSPKL